MPAPPHVTLTPAQLAKQAERKAAKLAKKAATAATGAGAEAAAAEADRRRILRRSWVPITGAAERAAEGKLRARIVTWNVG
jgi:hypothetical protein